MSLRTRLLLALLGLVAVGLVVAGAITYSSLRSFLLERVDQQLLDARRSVALSLAASSQFPGLPDQGNGPGPSIPPGTYGELRDSGGNVLSQLAFTYSGASPPTPRLPSPLPGATNSSPQGVEFSVRAKGSSPVRFRVLVQAYPQADRVLIVAIPLTDTTQTLSRLLGIEVLVSALVLGALAAAAWWLIKRDLRPLESMAATAGEIAAGDLAQRVEPAEPKTEVGRLGLALNAMLAQIEEAFAERTRSEDKLRRFVADASHELRTPLTSIRGYAEVFDKAKENPDDASSSMRRIEEESKRMGVLVDELLQLARLGEGRQPEHIPVDLTHIVSDAVSDARVAAPARAIDLVTSGDGAEPAAGRTAGADPATAAEQVIAAGGTAADETPADETPADETPADQVIAADQTASPVDLHVLGDDHQLRQVVTNLIGNALRHTPDATPVHVRLRGDRGWAILEVADEGPGLPDGDPAKLFEPFYRADPSRARETGGTGLGLAIVAAIVKAHGGEVAAASRREAGATFTVRLPLLAVPLPPTDQPAPLEHNQG